MNQAPAPVQHRQTLAREPRTARWLRVAMAAASIGPLLLLAYVGWSSHQRAIADGRARLGRVAQIAQEQSQRLMETNEVISRAVAGLTAGQSNTQLLARRPELHQRLAELTAGLKQLQSVWIWDDQGRPIATNLALQPPATLNVSDRSYFRQARRSADDSWYVSEPLQSRTTGQTFFDFSKRRNAPDGSFAGAVSVSLLPAYFQEFFRDQVAREPGFTLSLFRADGVIVSRYPPSPKASRLGEASPLRHAMEQGQAAGSTEGVSTIDGHWRYVAFRRVGSLPLYAAATARQDLLLAPWRHSFALLALFTLPLSVGLTALCGFALRSVRREHVAALAHEEQYEQRLRAEEALRQAQKMEALGRLTGGVAHDFNNILMVVQTNAALARKLEERGRPLAQAIAAIERAVANGAQLTRQLLAIARRQPLQVQELRVEEIIAPVAELMASTLGRQVHVECTVAPDAGCVRADQAELELALINLCMNARDAMPEGGSLRLAAQRAVVDDGEWVRVSVADEGEGIEPELLAKVMEPFFTTKPVGKGTGLGLSQVQSFVQASGGRIRIDSTPGQGTTVEMLLPRVAPAAPPRPETRNAGPLHGCVLLVEDNDDIAGSLVLLLEQAGAGVVRHATAEGALAAIEAGTLRPDAVLSDISLAGALTGVDLARTVSSRATPLPVVLMTGYTSRLHEAVAMGFRVLPKPVPPEQLVQALTEAMRAHHATGSTRVS